MLVFDTEAGGRALFDVTFNGTLPSLSTWEDQPKAMRDDMCRKALAVAVASVLDVDDAPPGVTIELVVEDELSAPQDPRAQRPASDA